MPIPTPLQAGLRLPVIASPMFLVSGPDLVINACRSGVIGTFPALNQRSSEGFEDWLVQIKAALAETPEAAAFGVNLIVHKSNPRVQADLALCVKHQVPLVITSLGAVSDVVDAVHSYGGVVFHDVINLRHAKKAIAAGVDGLILVSAGAGGHAGTLNPFAFLKEIRAIFDGTIILAGAIGSGEQIAAAQMAGADFAYMGTRFIATDESMAGQDYKAMLENSAAADIIYTDSISGVYANFIRESLVKAGLDPDNLPAAEAMNMDRESRDEAKAWKNIWSAGHGVGDIAGSMPVAALVDQLSGEYQGAIAAFQQKVSG